MHVLPPDFHLLWKGLKIYNLLLLATYIFYYIGWHLLLYVKLGDIFISHVLITQFMRYGIRFSNLCECECHCWICIDKLFWYLRVFGVIFCFVVIMVLLFLVCLLWKRISEKYFVTIVVSFITMLKIVACIVYTNNDWK